MRDELDVVAGRRSRPRGGDDVADRRSWCVAYTHPTDPEEGIALLAVEIDDNGWRGMRTVDEERVRRVDEAIATNL